MPSSTPAAWVAGPYPEDATLSTSCPPEKDPDPSRPVPALSGPDELTWRSLPTGPYGHVDLKNLLRSDHLSAYALAYVFSPDERTASLLVSADDKAQIWLNGRIVHEPVDHRGSPVNAVLNFMDRLPVTLRAGRNVLLVKVSSATSDISLRLRIGDSAFDRGFTSAELGLWDEASAGVARAIDLGDPGPAQTLVWYYYASLVAASGDMQAYRRLSRRLFDRFGPQDSNHYPLTYACTLAPDPVANLRRLVELGELGVKDHNNTPRAVLTSGLAFYRAGRFQEALGSLEQARDKGDPRAFPRWP